MPVCLWSGILGLILLRDFEKKGTHREQIVGNTSRSRLLGLQVPKCDHDNVWIRFSSGTGHRRKGCQEIEGLHL